MRINRLELIKYGKFTDRVIDFPATTHDFHFITGPNEAGKSTVRNAVQELLFGIMRTSPLNFIHPISDLRLGASISNGGTKLDFHRVKADKRTLRSSNNDAMDDSALTPFLGATDRLFFDQMFGLDHSRLINGGKSILSASDNLGQTLFQSAAGIDSMGRIRDELIRERDSLYSPRRAADREFYIAHDSIDAAVKSLREASIRATTWGDAFKKVETLAANIEREVERHKQLETQRNRLERQRRTAPFYVAVQETESQLAELSEVADLPADAAKVLAGAQQALATAEQLLSLRSDELARITHAFGGIALDDAVTAVGADVLALEKRRQQYSAYAQDIVNREAEVEHLWRAVLHAAAQLGWQHGSPDAMRERIPTLLVRRALNEHTLLRSGLVQAVEAAEQALVTRNGEIAQQDAEMAAIVTCDIAPALRASLSKARAIANSQAAPSKVETDLKKAANTLQSALKALGAWRLDPDVLAAQALPGEAGLNQLEQDSRGLVSDLRAASRKRDEDLEERDRIALLITQFQEAHQPTTAQDVAHARTQRDAAWIAIKTSKAALDDTSGAFEGAMRQADAVADRRVEHVEEASTLQTMEHEHERAQTRYTASANACESVDTLLSEAQQRWDAMSNAAGLGGLALDAASVWMSKRQKALDAATALQDAQASVDAHDKAASGAKQALVAALLAANVRPAEGETLEALCVQTELLIQNADNACIRLETLSTQVKANETVRKELTSRVEQTAQSLASWNDTWVAYLGKAGLPVDADVGTARGALDVITDIEDKLEKIRVLRVDRIEAMQRDLTNFNIQVRTLASQLNYPMITEPLEMVVLTLTTRLTLARQAADEAARLKRERTSAEAQVLAAREAIETAQGVLEPLRLRAGVATNDLLAGCIDQSDRKRMLTQALANAQATLLQAGDGLTRAQIQAELTASEPARVAADLDEVKTTLSEVVALRESLSAEHANANRTLMEMVGSEGGATAEAQRQEAMARMRDAAERYVRVATAAKMLSWSIERYREEKQGPMLKRASEIFHLLTLGAFKKLHVDFEKATMILEGMREDGKLVSVAGMSDGTRDQLYFALRLAALEMHLEQAIALPFLADDLFINYDDARSKAGLEALKDLSTKTQVIFLSHHNHLDSIVQEVFGANVNVVSMAR